MPRCGLRKFVTLAVAGLLAFALGVAVRAEEPAAVEWLTGSALENRYSQPVTLTWTHTPLKPAVTDLAKLHRVALMLDRRVDPELSVQFAVIDVPLERACEQLAGYCRLGFCRLGPIGYFGPVSITARLRTVAALRREEAQRLPAEAQAVFSKTARWQWDDFATPRELLAALADHAGIRVRGDDQIPHDLWAAGRWPSMSLIDRLTLLAVQYDLTFRYEDAGQTIVLVPLPDEVFIERSYAAGGKAAEQARRWATLAPRSRIEVVGSKIVVRGPVEDHERLTPGKKMPVVSSGPTRQMYTLTLQGASLKSVLEVLEARLQVKIRVDQQALAQAKISLDQPIALRVANATLDELFTAALAPAGLTFRHEGDEIVVVPAKPKP